MTRFALSRPTAAATAVLLTAVALSTHHEHLHHVSAFAPPISSTPSANVVCGVKTVGGNKNHARLTNLNSSVTSSSDASEKTAVTSEKKSSSKTKKFTKSQTKSKSSNPKKNNNHNKPRPKSTATKNNDNNNNNNNNNNLKNPKSFKPLKDLKLGSTLTAKVIDVCDFGAFLNIGYATRGSRPGTALLHISQISDERITDIRSVIKKGDIIEDARVITIDLSKGEVGLSLRQRRPKRRDISTIKMGDELEGKVDSVVPYGAFVDVGANVNALLHISRITGGAIENIRHHLNEGDPVSVHVIDVDKEKKTMAVSMLDRKADLYLDRRLSQKMKKFYGMANGGGDTHGNSGGEGKKKKIDGKGKNVGEEEDTSDLDYFDQAIRELEEALRDRE